MLRKIKKADILQFLHFCMVGTSKWKSPRFFLMLALLLLLFGLLARIFTLYSPRESTLTKESTVKTLALPPADHIGVNYYHESMGYLGRTDAEINSDLDQIQLVANKIKVYHNPFTNTGEVTAAASLQIVEHIVQKAKARKMYVVWVENDDSVTLTDANWGDYANRVIADAAEAYRVGADEFLVGNEISLHNNGDQGYNDTNLPARIKQLVSDCQTNYPGTKGYEEGWYKSESWKAATLGSVDKIYFTLYEPWHTFQTAFDQIAAYFGKRAEIGELSTMTTKSNLNDTEEDWTRELMRRYDYARQKGLTIWLFTFRETGNGGFGLVQFAPSNQPHEIWEYWTEHKIMTYHEFFFDDFNNGTTQNFSGNGYNYKNRLAVDPFAQTFAFVPVPDYVFRGSISPIFMTGSEKWRAMRLVFRYSDNNNYYFVTIEPNDNKILLFRRQRGVESFLGAAATSLHMGTDYDFEIRISGSGPATTIQVFWDTVKVINVTDRGNVNLNSGEVGMKNNGVMGDLDDIVVTDFEQ